MRESRHEFLEIMQDIKPDTITGCIEWPKKLRNPAGYGYHRLVYDGVHRPTGNIASRASWRIFRGDIPKGLFVCHHCDNPPCVHPDHLFLGTALDNALDAKQKRDAKKRKRQK